MPESPSNEADSPDAAPETAALTVEAYETDAGVVFYDAVEPTAWLQAERALPLDEMA